MWLTAGVQFLHKVLMVQTEGGQSDITSPSHYKVFNISSSPQLSHILHPGALMHKNIFDPWRQINFVFP